MARKLGVFCLCLLLAPGCGRLGKRGRVPATVAASETDLAPELESADGTDAAEELAEARKRSAELEQRLDNSTLQVEQLRRELEATRRQIGAGGVARDTVSAPELWGHTPAALPPGMAAEQPADSEAPQTIIASLRHALSREQQRRESIEKELARLKIETSAPVFGDSRIPEADFLAVKQELVELRRTLDHERRTREQISEQLRNLQVEKSRPAAAGAAMENGEMRARLRKLEDDKRRILESLDRSVAISQRRASELERRLHNLRSSSGGRADAVAAIRAENAALRSSLDEERKRTELLAAKLKAANKITDLIKDIDDQKNGER